MCHFWQRDKELVWKVPEEWFSPLSAVLGPGLLKRSPVEHLRTLMLIQHHGPITSVFGVGPRHQEFLNLPG